MKIRWINHFASLSLELSSPVRSSSKFFIISTIFWEELLSYPEIAFLVKFCISFFNYLSISHWILFRFSFDVRFWASLRFNCYSSPWYTLLMLLILSSVSLLFKSNLAIVVLATYNSCWSLLRSASLAFKASKWIFDSSLILWISLFLEAIDANLSSSTLLIFSSSIFLKLLSSSSRVLSSALTFRYSSSISLILSLRWSLSFSTSLILSSYYIFISSYFILHSSAKLSNS